MKHYISRHIEAQLLDMVKRFKVLLVTGPRQVGKTTTLKYLFEKKYGYVTLDDLTALTLAKEDPKLFFKTYGLPLIIDEAQLAPSIFSEIKRLVDAQDFYGQVILTGSQTFHLMEQITESLAGRVGIIEFSGLSYREINDDPFILPFVPNEALLSKRKSLKAKVGLWEMIYRGSMPELYRQTDLEPSIYYASYVRTYLERDVRSLVQIRNLDLFSKFLISLAARTGQMINYDSLAKEIGVDTKSMKRWTSILETSGIIYLLRPYSNNRLTRLVSTPMVYFLDTGLASYLLRWNSRQTLQHGAMSGAMLQTYVVSEIIKSFRNKGVLNPPLFFYRDYDQKEIDLIIEENAILYPVEIKQTMNPNASMIKAYKLLEKAKGYQVGQATILCMVEQIIYLTEDVIAFPIEFI